MQRPRNASRGPAQGTAEGASRCRLRASTAVVVRLDRTTHGAVCPLACASGGMGPPVKPEGRRRCEEPPSRPGRMQRPRNASRGPAQGTAEGASRCRLLASTAVVVRLDRTTHGAICPLACASGGMGPPVKPEGRRRCEEPPSRPGRMQRPRHASRGPAQGTAEGASRCQLRASTTVVVRLDRTTHGAICPLACASGGMGPPVKPEGDGGVRNRPRARDACSVRGMRAGGQRKGPPKALPDAGC